MRHAKTEPYSETGDITRNLTNRGVQDAEKKALAWKEKYPLPDAIFYSSAHRTTQTMNIISDILQIPHDRCLKSIDIYYATPTDIDLMIHNIEDNSIKNIAIIGHNNTLTDYLNEKIDNFHIDNLPTSCFVGFQLKINNWNENSLDMKGRLLFHETSR